MVISLIIVAGLPGVGKTTLCKIIKKKLKCRFFSSDDYAKKKDLFNRLKNKSHEQMDKIRLDFYDEKINEVKKLLKRNRVLVMDAAFDKEKLRKKFYKMIRGINGKITIIKVVAPDNLIRERIVNDTSGKGNKAVKAFGRLEMYKKIKREWEPIRRKYFVVDSSRSIEPQINSILNKLI
jgi:predicted kinase